MKLSEEEIQTLINEDEDYIKAPKYKNSLKRFMQRFPDGVENDKIAEVLGMTEEEVEEEYMTAIAKIKRILGVRQ